MQRTERFEVALRVCFAGALVAVGAGAYNACFCGGCGCGDNLPDAGPYTVTFTMCALGDGGDAQAADAGDGDAGDASAVDGAVEDSGGTDAAFADAGACFTSCDEACQTHNPNGFGTGTCLFSDAGANGQIVATCESRIFCGGRRFDGLDAPAPQGWLADMAWLEAASVHAFRRLARELKAHGAPAELVARAREAARDEIRHARLMGSLARKRGAPVPATQRPQAGVRDLETIARENAVEGCVGETYGALYAAFRAIREEDAEIAAAMSEIAPDELRHAALGWAVADWADSVLDGEQRARVRDARMQAARDLVTKAPSAEERALAESLMQRLWA